MGSTWRQCPYENADDWIDQSALPYGRWVARAILHDVDGFKNIDFWTSVTGEAIARFGEKSFQWTAVPHSQTRWEELVNKQVVPGRPLFATAVKNKARDENRRRRRRKRFTPTDAADVCERIGSASQQDGLSPEFAVAHEYAWSRVSEPGKTYILEKAQEGLSRQQIAERHGVTPNLVDHAMRKARKEYILALAEFEQGVPNA